MESLLVWIVLFAVAAIALLGIFLVAAEKELKKKRRELDLLLAKIEGAPPEATAPMAAPDSPAGDSEEVARLLARNQELERDLASVASKLEASKLTDDELALAQRNVEIAKANAQWLQSTNDQLKGDLDALKKRFEASAAPMQPAASQPNNADARQRELENEVADLQQQLAENRAKIRELVVIEHKLENVDAIETNHREEKRGLNAKIAELEQELSEQALKANESESLAQRLAESERTQQTLSDERRGFEQELARWQARAANAEEHSRQLTALREPFDKLLAKQALLEERQREYQEALEQFSELVVRPDAGLSPAAGFNEFHAAAPVPNHRAAAIEENVAIHTAMALPEQMIAAAHTGKKPKRLFGLFPAIIVLAAAGILAAGLWKMNNSGATAPATVTASALPARPQIKPAVPPVVTLDVEPVASESPATPAKANQKTAPAKPVQAVRVEPSLSGTYEVTQASRVYAAPSELAQAMGDIEPGTKVSVINGKNGWLEIYSKHGRPTGYIRKDIARLAAAN
jgi:hypothetical protein